MKCIYYSRYSHAADDRKVVDAKEYGCKWHGDALDMPFRLYKAAECESDHVDPIEMVDDLFEVLDMPYLENRNEPFKVTYNGHEFDVNPTKHYYGATNEVDGVFEIGGVFYIIYCDVTIEVDNWKKAVDKVAHYCGNCEHYLKGIDYKPQ